MTNGGAKSARLLAIYCELVNGAILNKLELAKRFHVNQRSIQRDMESLRCFFADQMLAQDIIYDSQVKGYRLTSAVPKALTNSEILAVCKILLESRSMMPKVIYLQKFLIYLAVPDGLDDLFLIIARGHHYATNGQITLRTRV